MGEEVHAKPSAIAGYLAALVRFYQLGISPLLRPSCRFIPSCSEYAYTALTEQGAFRGSWLAVRRLLRCHPFCAGGYDPVPAGRPGPKSQHCSSATVTAPAIAAPRAASQEAGECLC